ncbi:hypothetical protein BDV93DRAFT_520816 [Ceratobasidium sp. AG-I]|nr:hypothetical protein BDV93DRAFT_520816 [Ceratobasidium sp. AG-I]
MDAYDFITKVNELFSSQHASQIAAILLINSLVSFDTRTDRLVIDDADREAILALSKEFLHLAAHLRCEINFAPALGIPEQVLRDAYSFGIDLKYMCKYPKQSSRSRMMEAHTLLCYAAVVRHFHSQLTDWDLVQIKDSFLKDRHAHRSVNRTCGVGARRQKGAGRRMVDACIRSAHHLRNTSTSTSTSTATTTTDHSVSAKSASTNATSVSSHPSSSQYTTDEFGSKVRTGARPPRSRTNAQWI